MSAFGGEKEVLGVLEEVNSLSATRINNAGKVALKHVKYYKHVVYLVEKWGKKQANQQFVLFVIDSIVKQSHKALGASEPYAERFAQNLSVTLEPVTSLNKDIKLLIYRAIQTWAERNLFSESAIKSLGELMEKLKKDVDNDISTIVPSLSSQNSFGNLISSSVPITPTNSTYAATPSSMQAGSPVANIANSYSYSTPYSYPQTERRSSEFNDRYDEKRYDSAVETSRNRHSVDFRRNSYEPIRNASSEYPPRDYNRDFRNPPILRESSRDYREPTYKDRVTDDTHARKESYDFRKDTTYRRSRSRSPNREYQSYHEASRLPVSNSFYDEKRDITKIPAPSVSVAPPVQTIPIAVIESVKPAFDFDYGDSDDEYLTRRSKPIKISDNVSVAPPVEVLSRPLEPEIHPSRSRQLEPEIHPSRSRLLEPEIHPARMNLMNSNPMQSYQDTSFNNSELFGKRQSQRDLPRLDGMIYVQNQSYIPSGHVLIASTTLWLGAMPPNFGESDIRSFFSQFGNISSLKVMNEHTAFVSFETRSQAEIAKSSYYQTFKMKIGWGRGITVPKENYMWSSGIAIVTANFLEAYNALLVCDVPIGPFSKEIREYLSLNFPGIEPSSLPPLELSFHSGSNYSSNLSSYSIPNVNNINTLQGAKTCNFGLRCRKAECRFIHPDGWDPNNIQATSFDASQQQLPLHFKGSKPCKFGSDCNKPSCLFTHPLSNVSQSSAYPVDSVSFINQAMGNYENSAYGLFENEPKQA